MRSKRYTPGQTVSKLHVPEDGPLLVKRTVELAKQYGRYGYRRVPLPVPGVHVCPSG